MRPESETEARLETLRRTIDATLDARLPSGSELAPRLVEAMRYAVQSGGKRIRPLLTLATTDALGGDVDAALPAACAVELIHAYSLVHDDLPAMDDDDLRRGRPTVHIAFDEATAILAGDALQSLAFEWIADAQLPPATRLSMVRRLATASGFRGMVGGQAYDMGSTGASLSLPDLERLHRGKTGALLSAAVDLGALAAGASEHTKGQLSSYGRALGLAFQIVDDLLDVTESTATQGKRAGVDAERGKNTFPGLLGIEVSRARAAALLETALAALAVAGIAEGPLHAIARQIVVRRS
jgi:geranylgeranyl diphosphate synthase type II